MTSHDDLERVLGQQLNRQASGVHGTPLGLDDVKGRAGRIQRSRRLAAGIGVAAALAVIVPVSITAGGALQGKGEVDPAVPNPTPVEVARTTLTLDGLPRGEAPRVEYFTSDGVVLPGQGLRELPDSYEALVPNTGDGGWFGWEGSSLDVRYLSESFETQGESATNERFISSPDRSMVAWGAPGPGAQTLVLRSTTDPADTLVWDFPDDPVVDPVDFAGDRTLVYQTMRAGRVDRIGLAIDGADGPTTVPFSGDFVKAVSAEPTHGLVAVQTQVKEDASGCFGVLDSREDLTTPIWETCQHSLGAFSPGGRYLLASSPQLSGLGPTELDVLDARTGHLVASFKPEGDTQVTLLGVVWESTGTALAVALARDEATIVRLGVDGTLEETVDRVGQIDSYGDLPLWTGRDRVRGY